MFRLQGWPYRFRHGTKVSWRVFLQHSKILINHLYFFILITGTSYWRYKSKFVCLLALSNLSDDILTSYMGKSEVRLTMSED